MFISALSDTAGSRNKFERTGTVIDPFAGKALISTPEAVFAGLGSRSKVQALIRENLIQTVKIGRSRLIVVESVRTMIAAGGVRFRRTHLIGIFSDPPPRRDHRIRRASPTEIAWAKILPDDVPKGCIPYAAICRDEPERWVVAVFVGPAKLKTKPGREESTAQYCFINAGPRIGYFRPVVVN